MRKLFDYIDNVGLSNFESVERTIIESAPITEVIGHLEKCFYLSNPRKLPDVTPGLFDFAANHSLSGGISPCTMIECRARNARNLVTFAALYSDSVLVTNPFDFYFKRKDKFVFENNQQEWIFRNEFAGALDVILTFRKAIEEGVVLVNPTLHLVDGERRQLLRRGEQRISGDLINFASSKIINRLMEEIKITMAKPKTVLIEGLGKFFPENNLEYDYAILPQFLEQYNHNFPNSIPNDLFPRMAACSKIVDESIDSILMQKLDPFVGHKFSYMTNSVVESMMIESLNTGTKAETYSQLFLNSLAHTIPFVPDADLIRVMDLRRNEAASFRAYQYAVRKLVKQTAGQADKADLSDALNDIILPEVFKLEKLFQRKVGTLQSTTKMNLGIVGLELGFGLATHNLPIIFDSVLKGVGVGKSAWNSYNQIYDQQAESDYYFLWKSMREIGKNSPPLPYSSFMPPSRVRVLTI